MLKLKQSKYIWRTYRSVIDFLARKGVTKLLPLQCRRHIGTLIQRMFSIFSPIDTQKPQTVFGHTMYLHPLDETPHELVFGTYEHDTVEVFKTIAKPGSNVVDLGAHIGFYSLLGASIVGPKGQVYAFEPQPIPYSLLLKNIEANGYQHIVKAIPKVVSNKEGIVDLFIGDREGGKASIYAKNSFKLTKKQVETTTLDQFFATEDWPEIDLIKMDIEGAEKQALEGMKELSKRNPDLKLIMEFSVENLKQANIAPEELFQSLTARNFQRFSIISGSGVKLVNIPEELPRLISARDTNILCEK